MGKRTFVLPFKTRHGQIDESKLNEMSAGRFRVRAGHWDDRTLSSGPCPVKLSDGNWLVLYNIDNKWPVDNPKPIPKYGRCALGWAVLASDGLTTGRPKVLARASEPLLWGNMPYDSRSYDSGPSVYTDGMRALGNDTFVVYAGGADQVVEAVRIQVTKATRV